MLNFILIVAYFPLCVFCADDFILIFPSGDEIPYTPVALYQFSQDVKMLDSGKPVETFDEVAAEEMLTHSKLCELKRRTDSEGETLYTPALCTISCERSSIINIQNGTCDKRYGRLGVCCPADKIPFYRNNFPVVKLEEHEPTNYRFYRNRFHVDWNIVNVRVIGSHAPSDLNDLVDEEEFQMELEKETVCGVRIQDREIQGKKEKEYILFFCIQEQECTAPVRNDLLYEYIADPLWDEFCSNRIRKHLRDHEFFNTQKYRCCHTNYIPEDHFKRKYTDLKFRNIPSNLKYAPGLRSNLMCEEYSRLVCGKPPNSLVNECDSPQTPNNRPPELGDAISITEAPYIARLGVVAPHVLIFHCLGAIVSERYIISVATCRQAHGINTNIAIVGEDDTDDLYTEYKAKIHEQVYVISKIIQIPQRDTYEPTLYRTSKDIKFNSRVRPACLYYHVLKDKPVEGVLNYFGKLRNDNYKGQFLRKQTVSIDRKNHLKCQDHTYYELDRLNERYRKSGFDTLYEFCGDASSENKVCKYDRGSPLVQKLEQPYCSWLIHGLLTSERWNCEQQTPLAFTNITVWLGEIEDIVWPLPFLEDTFPPRPCQIPRYTNSGYPTDSHYYWKLLWPK